MSWGSIYGVSWFGNTNESNGWGIVYPFDADGSYLTSDVNTIKADTTAYRADATEY
jgi:hypothetical protein